MSIPSLINPPNYETVQDSLWHIASSTNSGQTDFKYVFDVFKEGQQLVRVKIFPDVNNGKGYFDAGAIVRNEISYDWFIPTSSDNCYLNSFSPTDAENYVGVLYDVRVGEDYSGTTYLNLASGTTTAYNYAAPLFHRKDISGYGIQSKANKWLSNRDKQIKIGLDDKLLIPVYNTLYESIYLRVKIYGINNNLIATYNEATEGGDGTSGTLLQLDIGTNALNNKMEGTGKQINSSTKYYTIELYNGTTTFGGVIFVTLECNPKYTTTNLYFINQWGMFDTARFSLVRKLTMDIERKGFEQKDYSLNTSSVTYYDAKNVYNESKINYGSKANWSYKLTMDFPSDIDYRWLAELIQSPQIYAEIEGNYYPVSIKASNYEYSEYVFNKLKVFEIDIELNQKRYGFIR